MLCVPHHDNSSLIASLGYCNLASMHLSDSGSHERTLRFGALLHLVLGRCVQNTATGCWCRIKDSGLGGSNVSSLGVSTIRPGHPFLWAAPSSWDEWRSSVRSWRSSRSNRKSGSRKFDVGCFKIECWVHNRPPITQDFVRPSLKVVYCRELGFTVLSGKERGEGERQKQRQRQGKTQKRGRGGGGKSLLYTCAKNIL